jgi:hypothetical protein
MSNAPDSRHLRLTLRTLLAWLDDTLPAAEVRQMGNQVSESAVAKELVDRIQSVTRRRRLTIPPSTGPDSVDPNVVAAYLDNELSPEQIAEYEKRCLTSDVHLAEAASSHQILSMIGQKAKVPPEARHRMYRLVRGRESVGRDVPRTFIPPREPASAVELHHWATTEPPAPPAWTRFLLPLAALSLVVLMAVSAWMLAPGRPSTGEEVVAVRPRPTGAEAQRKPAPVVPEPVLPPARAEATEATTVEADQPKVEEPAPAAPAADPATVVSGDSVAGRWNPTSRAWERLDAGAALKAGDRVVGLAPFHTELKLGGSGAVLIGPAEVRIPAAAADGTPQIEPLWGRVEVEGGAGANALVVVFGGSTLRLTGLDGHEVGLEPFGPNPDHPTGGLRVYATEGTLQLVAGKASETLTGPGSIELIPPDQLEGSRSGAAPRWLGAGAPTEVERVAGEAFRVYFKPGMPTTRALVEALEDDQESVRTLAAQALGSLGQIDEVVFALGRPGDPAVRRAAAEVLRAYDDRGEDAVKAVTRALERASGTDSAAIIGKLLAGYSAEEAADAETTKKLVQWLDHGDVTIRQLAIDQLTALTGRDSLGYNPDEPKGTGLKAWQDLSRTGGLGRRR